SRQAGDFECLRHDVACASPSGHRPADPRLRAPTDDEVRGVRTSPWGKGRCNNSRIRPFISFWSKPRKRSMRLRFGGTAVPVLVDLLAQPEGRGGEIVPASLEDSS